MNTEGNRRLLNVQQAGEYLGLSSKTLYSWIESGRLPYVALGRRRLLDVRELEKFIRANTVTARPGRSSKRCEASSHAKPPAEGMERD